MFKTKQRKIIIISVALSIFLIIISAIFLNNPKQNVPYLEFKTYLSKNQVEKVYIKSHSEIDFYLKNGIKYTTFNPNSNNFKEDLLSKGIPVYENGYYNTGSLSNMIISVILLSSISVVVYKSIKSSKKVKNNSTFHESKVDNSPFTKIAGNVETIDSLRDIVDFLKNPEKYNKFKARKPKGIILYGPPGTGKTLLAKSLAYEANVPFYSCNGSDFVQVYAGVGASRIRELFKKASNHDNAIIFIDEIDAIGKKRVASASGANDEKDQTLNALLGEMSGFNSNKNIIVVAATNRLDTLDEALLRPGRFDRHIEVNLPDINARRAILSLYLKDKPSKNIDLDILSNMTVYFSGAKLENLINEAAILAAKNNLDYITMEEINTAYEVILAGIEKKDRSYLTLSDKKITAYHESGHAIVSRILQPNVRVNKISIIPSTKGTGGYTLNIPENTMYHTKDSLIAIIKTYLAGRAAEEIVLGENNITTGAEGDIRQSTTILLSMIKNYGMFKEFSLVNYDVLGTDSSLNTSIQNIINNMYTEVKSLLNNNLNTLHIMANTLIEKETLNEEEILNITKRLTSS